jgi:hypothetical protein
MPSANITYTFDLEADGIDTEMTYSQGSVEDLQDWLWFISEATRAAGFTYVDRVIAVKDDGSEVSSGF